MSTIKYLSIIVIALVVFLQGGQSFGTNSQNTEAENNNMLFLCYWELNENIPTMQHVQVAKQLTESGLFPPPGVELIRMDKTASGWGVTTFKAESAEAATNLITLWRLAVPGFFKKVKLSPAMPVPEAAANAAKLFQSMKKAEADMKAQQK